jgi:hypothetical protein
MQYCKATITEFYHLTERRFKAKYFHTHIPIRSGKYQKKMSMKSKILILLFILTTSVSCEDNHPFERVYRFWVENKSDKPVYFLVSYTYPDTTIPDTYNEIGLVSPNSKNPIDSDKKWEEVFRELPADTLSVFIFSSREAISINNWQEIRSEYKILKRYDISIDDLKNNSWIISYP